MAQKPNTRATFRTVANLIADRSNPNRLSLSSTIQPQNTRPGIHPFT